MGRKAGNRLIWRGRLTAIRINERRVLRKRRRGYEIGVSEQYRAAVDSMSLTFQSQWRGGPMVGPVRLCLSIHERRRHAKGDMLGLPLPDVDSCIKAVHDALEHAGVVSNDSQIMQVTATKMLSPSTEGVEVEVAPW